MSGGAPRSPGFSKLRLMVSADAAPRLADAIGTWEEPATLAVTFFEFRDESGRTAETWVVEAYFDGAVGRDQIDEHLAALLAGLGAAAGTRYEHVPDEDWTAKVQRDLAPVRAGRFVVHGSHDRATVGAGRWAIEIDAGEAFGTAHHGTTRGCLEAIDGLARGRHIHGRILDIGCGTGVLAIAAAKAWPGARVTASDNDPIAIAIAAANARLNGVGGRVDTVTAAGLEHARLRRPGAFDLVLANILAAPLIALAPAIARALARDGTLVLSGLLQSQTRAVLGAYAPHGLRKIRALPRGEWMTLVLARLE